jgi:hypothetical protein
MRAALLILVFLSATSTGTAAVNPARGNILSVVEEIDRFTRDVQETGHAFELTQADFNRAWAEGGPALVHFKQLLQITAMDENAGKTSLEKINWEREEEILRNEAARIAVDLFAQPIEIVNLTLTHILRTYLFEETARGPLRYILNAIGAYRFSAAEISRLKKEAKAGSQFVNGYFYTGIGALTLAAIINPKPLYRYALKAAVGLKRAMSAMVSSITRRELEEVAARASRLDKIIAGLERLSTYQREGTARVGIDGAARVGRARILAEKVSSVLMPGGIKTLLYVTGISAVGGAANVGWQALSKQILGEDWDLQPIPVMDLKKNVYDGLAVLRLTCRSFDFRGRLAAAKQPAIVDIGIMRELNGLFTEYEVLKTINPVYLSVVTLPESVSLVPSSGDVGFTFRKNGVDISEKFNCPLLKGVDAKQVTASLGEALVYLNDAFTLMRNAEIAKAKANDSLKK